MATGKQVHKKIVGTIAEITSQITNIDGQISATEREIERQNLIRERIITRLAEMFAENGGELAKRFSTINQRVQSIFNQKASRRATIISALSGLEAEINSIRDSIAFSDQGLGERQDRIIDTKAQIAANLKTNSEYIALEIEIEKLRQLVQKDTSRLVNLEADCHSKMSEYESDLYFNYLYSLKYGTKDYKPSLFPKLDSWLARVSHYDENLKKYNILQVIPDRVRQANEARRAAIAAKIEARDSIADKAEEAAGLKPLLLEVAEWEKRREEQMKTLGENIQNQTNLRREKTILDSGDDKYQREAKEALKSFFNLQSIQELRQQAQDTHTTEDDRLVKELEDAEREINEQRKNAKKLIEARKPLEEQLDRLKEVECSFTKNSYEGSRSRFDDNLDVDGLLLGYMAGSISQSVLSNQFESHHTVERKSNYSDSNYSSRSSSEDDSYRRSSSSSDSYSSHSSSSSDSYSSGGFDSGGGSCSSGGDF